MIFKRVEKIYLRKKRDFFKLVEKNRINGGLSLGQYKRAMKLYCKIKRYNNLLILLHLIEIIFNIGLIYFLFKLL